MGRESYAPVVYIGCTLAVSAGDCLDCSNQGEKTHSTVVALFPELWVLENITKEKANWALNMCAFTFFSESKCDQLGRYCAHVFLKIMDCNLINPFTPKLLLLISPSIWKGSLGNIIKHLSFLIDYRIWNTIAQEGGFDCFGPWLILLLWASSEEQVMTEAWGTTKLFTSCQKGGKRGKVWDSTHLS